MSKTSAVPISEIERIENDDELHDFGGQHGGKGSDFAYYWVIIRLIELEKLKKPDYVFVCEYLQDVAEFDSHGAPSTLQLYQLKKKEGGYWQASELTGQTKKSKVPKDTKPVIKLIKHVREFKSTSVTGAFVSNGKYEVELASKQRSVNDVSIGLHLLDEAHTDAITAAIATAEGVSPEEIDLSVVELRHVPLAIDDLQRHTSGVMLEYLGDVSAAHAGQASSLVETLFARIKARGRRTEKCPTWNELVARRGFRRSDFAMAVENLEALPDKAQMRQALFDKLSKDWQVVRTNRTLLALTACARDKVIAGEGNRWAVDTTLITTVCQTAEEENWPDERWFEALCSLLVEQLPELLPHEIGALAIYEMTEWSLSQTPV